MSQSESGSDFELILKEGGMRSGNRICVSDTKVQRKTIESNQHKVCGWVAGPRSSEREAWRSNKHLAEIQVQKFVAKFEVVPSLDPIQAISELPIGIEELR